MNVCRVVTSVVLVAEMLRRQLDVYSDTYLLLHWQDNWTLLDGGRKPALLAWILLLLLFVSITHTHTHTHLTAHCPGLPRWAGTRKVKPIWILLKQETVNGSGISWAMCKSAPHSRHNHASTAPLSFLQAECPSCHPTNSVKALKVSKYYLYVNRLVAWHSGRTSVSGRQTFPILRSTCSWWVTTNVGKPAAVYR